MTVDKTEVVTCVAFMIGVKRSIIEEYLDKEKLAELSESREACTIRYLSKLRTTMFQKFRKTDDEMRYNLKNLNSIEWYDHENIKALEKWGFRIVMSNTRSEQYMLEFTKLINENIDMCRDLYPDWINWEYIKDLFIIPKYTKKNAMKNEFERYISKITFYPFQMYINWNPKDYGNILYSDGKFLNIIYNMHEDSFEDRSKYKDAHEDTKANIYSFIQDSDSVAVVVDCENSDVYKLYSVIKNLDQDELAKISKIVLYDDYHTGNGWDYLERFTRIPVEHIEVERVTDQKSLVDIKMTAGVCKDFYQSNIGSFILVSSDSDYWGLISSLSDANFLVMYEYSKCGKAIKDALETRGIYYCSIDDFCSGNTEEFKRAALFGTLEKYLPDLLSHNSRTLLEEIYTKTRINASETEMNNFYNRYIKTLRLKINNDGDFYIEIDR